MTKLTTEQIKAIPSLKDQGHTNKTIALLYKVSDKTIQTWCKRLRKANIPVKEDKKGARPIKLT